MLPDPPTTETETNLGYESYGDFEFLRTVVTVVLCSSRAVRSLRPGDALGNQMALCLDPQQ